MLLRHCKGLYTYLRFYGRRPSQSNEHLKAFFFPFVLCLTGLSCIVWLALLSLPLFSVCCVDAGDVDVLNIPEQNKSMRITYFKFIRNVSFIFSWFFFFSFLFYNSLGELFKWYPTELQIIDIDSYKTKLSFQQLIRDISVQRQKGINVVQQCSLRNKKGAITLQSCMVIAPFSFCMEDLWTALMPIRHRPLPISWIIWIYTGKYPSVDKNSRENGWRRQHYYYQCYNYTGWWWLGETTTQG